jgi:hypothetical protein
VSKACHESAFLASHLGIKCPTVVDLALITFVIGALAEVCFVANIVYSPK